MMRHFKSERNAVLIKVNKAKKAKSLFYFPDNNTTAWRWPNAFVQVPDWQIPDQDNCWWCGPEDSNAFSGYMWWIDQAGRVWKVGGHGDPATRCQSAMDK